VVSKGNKNGINVVLERVTRLTHITKVKSKRASDTAKAIEKKLIKHPSDFVKSITYDNSTENAKHVATNEKLNCDSYFCAPYHSWEKGAVEQVNGLIRRYFPKGTDFNEVTSKQLKWVEDKLNNRPRKILGFKTPQEVYNEYCDALTN